MGLALNPLSPVLYVGFPTANEIGVSRTARTGKLNFETAVADSGEVVCQLRTDARGRFLYASNTMGPTISVYDVSKDATKPVEVQKVAICSQGGASYQLELTPDGKHLAVITQRFQTTTPVGAGNEIRVFGVDSASGKLIPSEQSIENLSLPGDTRPQEIAIF